MGRGRKILLGMIRSLFYPSLESTQQTTLLCKSLGFWKILRTNFFEEETQKQKSTQNDDKKFLYNVLYRVVVSTEFICRRDAFFFDICCCW